MHIISSCQWFNWVNNEQKNSHLNAFDDAIRDEIIVAFVLSWVYVKPRVTSVTVRHFFTDVFWHELITYQNSWSYQDSFIRNDSSGQSKCALASTFPFTAVADAYINVSLNASKNLDGPMTQESDWNSFQYFFFPSSSSNSPALTRKQTLASCLRKPIALCFAK